MPYLNGEIVKHEEIDPKKHKFVGMFRPPPIKPDGTWDVLQCGCGQGLWTVDAIHSHWLMGHMDIPQYVDL